MKDKEKKDHQELWRNKSLICVYKYVLFVWRVMSSKKKELIFWGTEKNHVSLP